MREDVKVDAPLTYAGAGAAGGYVERIITEATDDKPTIPSVIIAPPPTGLASVSDSSCFDVSPLDTRLCHPDIAPQAIVTNSIGHKGPVCGFARTSIGHIYWP